VPSGVNFVIEAEAYARFNDVSPGVDSFSQNTRSDASAGTYMQSVGSWGRSWLEYDFDIMADGVYEIAVRGTGISGGTNSFRVSLDGGADSVMQLNKDDSWGWKTIVDANSGLGPYSLSAGRHTLRLKKREPGAKIDQLSITPAGGSNLPIASFSPSSLDFVDQDVGSVSDPQSVILSNTGTAPLNISAISTTENFNETNNCGDVLVAGESCQIDIRFIPVSAGSLNGTLTVDSNDANSPASVILSGTGNNQVLQPSGPIVISAQQNVVISGLRISNPSGHCIEVKNGSASITIENSEIGPCRNRGVFIRDSSDITIRSNYIHDTRGVGVQSARSEQIAVTRNQIDRTKTGVYINEGQRISVTYNRFDTILGTFASDGLNAFIQFANVTGYGNRINYNTTYTTLGVGDVGDDINLFASHGMSDDPIQVNYNTIVGSGPRAAGSGIMLGDKGSTYAIAKGNTLVNPGGSAIGVVGGNNNSVINNIVYSKQLNWAGAGIFVRDYSSSSCRDITVKGNRVDWTSRSGKKRGGFNHGSCGAVEGWDENDWDASIDESIINLQ